MAGEVLQIFPTTCHGQILYSVGLVGGPMQSPTWNMYGCVHIPTPSANHTEEPVTSSEWIIGLTTGSTRGASLTSVITLKEIKAEEK